MKRPEQTKIIPQKLIPLFKILSDEASITGTLYRTHTALLGNDEPLSRRVHMLTPLLSSIITNTNGIGILVSAGLANESYILLRSLYERCLNYSYLIVAPEDDFKRWFEHSLQKGYRLLRRELIVSNFGIKVELKGHEEIWNTPEVADLMQKYQRKNSKKEKQEWSTITKNRLDRIDWLSKAGKGIAWQPFVFVEALFFDEASEAVHGTFYGSVFHRGFFDPTYRGKDKLAEDYDYSSLILSTTTVLLGTVVKAANLKMENANALTKSEELVQKVAKVLKEEIQKIDPNELEPSKRILKFDE